jgi:tetratricopeptide (TPR) repeat protein
MSDQAKPTPGGVPKYHAELSGDARVGIMGDHGRIDTLNMVTPRRQIRWPVVVGSPPPLASSFQLRRSVLNQLDGAEGTVVLRQVMAGDGGVGKSQIAAGVYGSSGADLRVWVAAESRAAVITGYAEAAVRLDLADAEAGPERLAGLFLRFLESTDKRCLIVLDDVADPNRMKELWPAGQARVVVTTRRRDAALTGGGRTMINVGVYTDKEAQAYVSERLGPLLDELPQGALNESGGLAADLGYLPLGLAQAAAVIIDQAISCAEYRTWFADRTRDLEELFPADAEADGYTKTVASTWGLAIDAANQLTPKGLAEPMAYLVAVLDPAGAPESIYTSQAARSYLAAMVEQDEVSLGSARGALRALHRLSVITHAANPSEPRGVRMHSLTGRAVLQTVDGEKAAGLVRVAADALVECWPDIESNAALTEALRANTATLSALRRAALWYQGTGAHRVLFRSGRSLAEIGLVRQAIAYFSELRDEAERLLGLDHPDTLTSRNNLALAYRSAGDLDRAIPLFVQNVHDRERVLGPNHPDTLSSRNSLALAYMLAEDLGRAIPLLEQNLADRERVLGPDHPYTLTSSNNLAYAYKSAGDLGRAIPLFEQSLTESERVLGPDHPETLTPRNNLALAYNAAGDLGRAIPLFEQNLTDSERVLGPNHPDTLTSRNNLAGAYQSVGDLGRAIPLFEQNLTESERVLGPNHPDTLTSRNNLAYAYQSVEDMDRAVPLFEQNLTDRERILGPDHPKTVTSRKTLAGAYEAVGRSAEAAEVRTGTKL